MYKFNLKIDSVFVGLHAKKYKTIHDTCSKNHSQTRSNHSGIRMFFVRTIMCYRGKCIQVVLTLILLRKGLIIDYTDLLISETGSGRH